MKAKERRQVRYHYQQFQHVMGKLLARMNVPDKAARCVVAVHGALNGRKLGPDTFIAHKWMARQLGGKWKEENLDVFVGRYLDAIKEAEYNAGRKFFKIVRANGVTQIMTSYEADYIGEVALWVLDEAMRSEGYAKNPAVAVSDELLDRGIGKLPEAVRPEKDKDGDGADEMAGAVIKGQWTKVLNLAAANLRRIAEQGGDPVREVRQIQRDLYNLAMEAERTKMEEDWKTRAGERERDPEGMWEDANGNNLSDTSEKFSTAPREATPLQFVGGPRRKHRPRKGLRKCLAGTPTPAPVLKRH